MTLYQNVAILNFTRQTSSLRALSGEVLDQITSAFSLHQDKREEGRVGLKARQCYFDKIDPSCGFHAASSMFVESSPCLAGFAIDGYFF